MVSKTKQHQTLCEECQNAHSEGRIVMTEIRAKMDNLSNNVQDLTKALKEHIQHSEEIMAKKADKEDVEKLDKKYEVLKDKLFTGFVTASIVLGGAVISLVIYIYQAAH